MQAVGPDAGTAFFGGPEAAGASMACRQISRGFLFAGYILAKLPDKITDDHAVLLSDILPTAYIGSRSLRFNEQTTFPEGNTHIVWR
jgi:hypothetical protein